jgi:hypothetical protein
MEQFNTNFTFFILFNFFSGDLWKNSIIETNKILELIFLINNHECNSPNIQIQKLNEIGVTVNLELFCSTCNKKIDWSGSSKIGKTKVLQVNKSVSLAGQFSSISYNEYLRLFAYARIKPLSEPTYFWRIMGT